MLILLQKFCIKPQLSYHFHSHRRKMAVPGETTEKPPAEHRAGSLSTVVKLLCRMITQIRPFLLFCKAVPILLAKIGKTFCFMMLKIRKQNKRMKII